jgi:hypothetical protein
MLCHAWKDLDREKERQGSQLSACSLLANSLFLSLVVVKVITTVLQRKKKENSRQRKQKNNNERFNSIKPIGDFPDD